MSQDSGVHSQEQTNDRNDRIGDRLMIQKRPWLVPVLIAINIVIFVLWHFPRYESQLEMTKNFLVSWEAIEDGRYWVLLTSVFSHTLLIHILLNMLVLQSFGSLLEQFLGARFFLGLFLVAGLAGSLSHALVSNFLLNEPSLSALGASGAIAGVFLVFALIFPRAKILLFGFIPMPALWGAGMFVGLDLWGLYAQASGGGLPIGHGAHLGGALAGVFVYYAFLNVRAVIRP